MDENEINALLDKFRAGTQLTETELNRVSAALTSAADATGKFQKAMLSAAGDITKSMVGFASNADAGAGNFKTLNPIIDSAGRAAKGLSEAFGSLG